MLDKHVEDDMAKKKITVFLPSLADGGAERVMINIANGLIDGDNISVDLLLVSAHGPYLNQVDNRINIVDLKSKRIIFSLFKVMKYLSREKPHAVLSALDTTNILMIWAAKLSRVTSRVVITVHCNFTNALLGAKPVPAKVLPWLVTLFYPMADAIVSVSKGVADDLSQRTGIQRSMIEALVNPVITPDMIEKSKKPISHSWFEKGSPPVVIGLGRLTYQKNFDLLIRAFVRVLKHHDARLLILGEGKDRARLEELVDKEGLGEKVRLEGFVENPYPYMVNSKVFVLSSRYEGLPTVLIEALYCTGKVVSTDCPSGPEEILENGNLGALVPVENDIELANAIYEALASQDKTIDASHLEQYKTNNVVKKYRSILGV